MMSNVSSKGPLFLLRTMEASKRCIGKLVSYPSGPDVFKNSPRCSVEDEREGEEQWRCGEEVVHARNEALLFFHSRPASTISTSSASHMHRGRDQC